MENGLPVVICTITGRDSRQISAEGDAALADR